LQQQSKAAWDQSGQLFPQGLCLTLDLRTQAMLLEAQ